MALQIPIDVAQRLRQAWDRVPPEKRSQLRILMYAARQEALRRRGLAAPQPDAPRTPHELALAHTSLFGDPNDELLSEEGLPHVDSEGNIWGTGTYEQLDPRWLEAVSVWFENMFHKAPFATQPVTLQIPDQATIGLVGDWGTGSYGSTASPALQISQAWAKSPPDIAIHLGDVYYAGTAAEESGNFLPYWTPGKFGSFALNSNHEMYPGATDYFGTLLANATFQKQNGTSYFALQNQNWIVVGLDSAYFSDYWTMYLDGNLDTTYQIPFLAQLAQEAKDSGKKVIVLTHHNGFEENGTGAAQTALWNQVLGAFPAETAPAYWYWGHVHVGVVYAPQQGVQARCIGHGAIPWGYASALDGQPSVIPWFETAANNVNSGLQVMNGYARLTLDGATLTEAIFDQTGAQAWP